MAYIGVQPAAGQYRKLDDVSAGFNGTSTTFTTSVSGENVTAGTAQQLLVSVGGVIQEPKTDYDVSTNSIVFTTAPAAGLDFFAVLMGDAVNTITVPDGSVTTAKLAGSLSVGLAGGTNSAPTLFFTGDTNTGVYSPGADQVAVTTGGTQRLLIDASGNVNVDSNTLYVDAANNRVGIGTSSVSRTLDVVSTDTWIRTARTGGNAWIVGTGVQDAYRIYDDTAGAERFRIDTSGRVGIGSTAPTNSLEVVGGATSNLFAVKASSSGDCLGVTARSAGNGAIVSALNSAQSDYEPLEINGEIIYFQTRTGAGTVSERARIDSSGRLLVGTSSAVTAAGFGTPNNQFVGDYQKSTILVRNTSNDNTSCGIVFQKIRNTSAVQQNDPLGYLSFNGYDGVTDRAGAYIFAEIDAVPGSGDLPTRLVFSTTLDGASSPTERMRIRNNGTIWIATGGNAPSSTVTGLEFHYTGYIYAVTSGAAVGYFNRNTSDGTLLEFRRDDAAVGTISVSGGTVSYNPFLGSHWGRLPDNQKTDILVGTILETVDQLIEWKVAVFEVEGENKMAAYNGSAGVGETVEIEYEGETYEALIQYEEDPTSDLNKHVCVKVNDTAGSKAVFGVFLGWDNDLSKGVIGTWNDMYCAAVGNYFVRMAASQEPEIGDLVEADGTGCGVVQDDDIIRTKTVAKITSTIPQVTYDDGSFLVTCVLCCG